jgi:hypothetical protein
MFDELTSAKDLAQIENLRKLLDVLNDACSSKFPESSVAMAARNVAYLYRELKTASEKAVAHAALVAQGRSF